MTTSDPVFIAEARPAKLGARQYYVWQIAMWAIIVYMAVVGMIVALGIGANSLLGGIVCWGDLEVHDPIHLKLAYLLMDSPALGFFASVILAPVVVFACYSASKGKRAVIWLVAYWVLAGTISGLIVSSYAIVMADPGYCGYWTWHTIWDWLVESPLNYFMPLPVTMLAALLTIERKKLPPDGEAWA